jgi:hypothetical protein
MSSVAIADLLPTAEIGGQWQRILSSFGEGIAGADATNELFWTIAAADIRGKDTALRLLSVSDASGSGAILPFVAPPATSGILGCKLEAVSAVYGNRSVVLAERLDPALVREIFTGLTREQPRWSTLLLRVAADSPSYSCLTQALDAASYRYAEIERNRSPYFHIPATWDELSAKLPQSLRWRIRKSQKELEKRGQLTYRSFTTAADAGEFIEQMYSIEQRSWKQQLGVAVTHHDYQQRFYAAAIPLAAQSGHLSGHVLSLDGDPIAYILGLVGRDRAFLAVKSSFVEAMSNLTPGHVLKKFAIEHLIAQGTKIWDFMGVCDEHKMRWTKDTYEVATLVVYNRSWRGQVGRLRSWLSSLRQKRQESKALPTRQDRAAEPAEPAEPAEK